MDCEGLAAARKKLGRHLSQGLRNIGRFAFRLAMKTISRMVGVPKLERYAYLRGGGGKRGMAVSGSAGILLFAR